MMTSMLSGFRFAFQNKRMIFLFYFANLLFALLVMLPLRAALNSLAGSTLMGESLAVRFDMDFLFEFINNNSLSLASTGAAIFSAGCLYWLANMFFSGGAYATMFAGENYSARHFWGNSAKYFGRFLRLGLWSLIVFGIFFSIQFLVPLIVRLIFGKDPYQTIIFWSSAIRTGVGYIGILLYCVVVDYGKITMVSSEDRSARRAIWAGVKFTFRHFFPAFGIALTPFVCGILLLFAYNPIADALHAPSWLIVLFLLLTQQLYIFSKMILRLALYGSQTTYYKEHQSIPAPEHQRESLMSKPLIQPAPVR